MKHRCSLWTRSALWLRRMNHVVKTWQRMRAGFSTCQSPPHVRDLSVSALGTMGPVLKYFHAFCHSLGFFSLYGSQKHWFIAIRRTSTLCQGPYKPVLTCAGFLLTGCGSMDLHPPFAMCTSRKKHCHCSVVNGQAFVRLLMTLSCKVFSTCTGITSNVSSCFTNILSPAYQRIPRNKKDFLCLLEFSQDVG